jgi:hypothetical protein
MGGMVRCKIKGCEFHYLLKVIQSPRFQIGNNRGRINGRGSAGAIFRRCVRAEN